jgi:hypothetical protein
MPTLGWTTERAGPQRDIPIVDVLILCRPGTRPPQEVIKAIESQRGVEVRILFGQGAPNGDDRNRWETIARGRNLLKQSGSAPWAMFVDDDVLLEPDCIKTLVIALKNSPTLAAIAADSVGEQMSPRWSGHIGMAACLFRREILNQLEFRSTADQCECLCCCQDLRRSGLGITYCADARAHHKRVGAKDTFASARPNSPDIEGQRHDAAFVLAAFDRRDTDRFVHQFMHSLRVWGNRTQVLAVGYGLYPSEINRLSRLPHLQLIAKPANGQMVPVRRLTDFAEITKSLPPHAPVAYWDVGDVVFQTNLEPLWNEIRRQPDLVRAVIEPKSYPHNAIIPAWSLSIRDPYHRDHVFGLLKRNGFLNSGFAAGGSRAMHAYFEAASRMLVGPELTGTSDWGDQMCLNLYCHSHPQRWAPIHQGWNFCVHDRPNGEVVVQPDGTIWSRQIGRIPVAHGNARSLRQFSLLIRSPSMSGPLG